MILVVWGELPSVDIVAESVFDAIQSLDVRNVSAKLELAGRLVKVKKLLASMPLSK